jgi:hypothetical protein
MLCLLPPIAPALAGVLAATALAALVLSFAADVRWLARRAGRAAGGALPEQA